MTSTRSRPTIKAMNETTSKINHLEEQVAELLELCKKLGDENNDLRAQLKHITSERATLLELKEKTRSQVEGMIMRLRSMESV